MLADQGKFTKLFQLIKKLQLVNDNLTESVDELLSGPHAEKWKEAMIMEYDGLIKNNVWELVKCPVNRSPIGSKWVLKTKYKENEEVERRKASSERFCSKTQRSTVVRNT